MAKSFVEVPQDAVRIRVGDNTELVAWQSEYNGEKQISFGKSTQYKEGGDGSSYHSFYIPHAS